jgi:hypothetical protein
MGRDLVVGWIFHQAVVAWLGQPGELANSIRAQTTTVPRDCNSFFRWGFGLLIAISLCVRPHPGIWIFVGPLPPCCGTRYRGMGFGHWFTRLAWRVGFARTGILGSAVAVSQYDNIVRLGPGEVYTVHHIPAVIDNGTAAQRHNGKEPRGDQTTTRLMSLDPGRYRPPQVGVVMAMFPWMWGVTTVAARLHAGYSMSFQLSRGIREASSPVDVHYPSSRLSDMLREGSWWWLLSECTQ